jgi:mycothiol synthase
VIREPAVEQADVIAELLNEHAQSAFGETEIAEAEVRHWFGMPDVWIRVAERDDNLVGYLDAVKRRGGAVELDIRTTELDVAKALLAAGAAHAGSGVLRVVVQGEDEILREAVEADGWKPVRHSFQMRIDLNDEVPEPRWPDGISARTIQPGDEQPLYEANAEAFADDWAFVRQPFEQWSSEAFGRENFDPALVLVAKEGGEVAGFSINGWHASGDPQFGWIGSLGVRPQWRRRGLATALLHQSFRDFRERGATRVGLGVDAENPTGAVDLYEGVGMEVARRNVTYEKRLS